MKKITDSNLLNSIEELTNCFGAPGFEEDVLEIIKTKVNSKSIKTDSINNLYIGLDEVEDDKPIVAFDCHSDEVGFIVENINPNGSLTFLQLGGWYVGNIPAHAVLIKNRKGEFIKGVVTSKPPHFMTPEELQKLPKLNELTIDIGTSSYEETTQLYGIEVGNPVVPDVKFSYDEKIKVMRAKAFDNRLGCVAVIEVLNTLINKDLNINPVGIISSQEEMGLRGAEVAAKRVKPNFAIIFEGSPADDTFRDGNASHGALRKGLQFRTIDGGMISNLRVLNYARKIADEKNIPYQLIAREKGSTNGARYHISGSGIPTLVIGIPTRYIHTHYSYASLEDLKSAIKLALEIARNITKEEIESF
ncbi:MAG: M20/M25/M40 family metallo-hydrolase [Cetobacterium sp.]|uniref:M42 family metallopeptidase n=1 Tax=Cetobacterium sp. TaxID=2071632 RepID=UPI002FC71457